MSNNKLSRKELGLCGSCNSPPRQGKTTCQPCADKKNTRERKRREEARAKGLCIHSGCDNRARAGQTRCNEHRQWRSKRLKDIRKQNIKGGLCAECGQEKTDATKLCSGCKDRFLILVHNKNFGGLREAVLQRERYACALCARTKTVVVHHIDHNNKNNIMENLVALCKRCHADIHRLGHNDRVTAANLISHSGKRGKKHPKKVKGWAQIRKDVLERDGGLCQICEDPQGKIVIHHKDDQGLTSKKPNNSRDNLIAMCRPCHNAVTNQRNNASRSLAARLVLALGAGTVGVPSQRG